jgi:hypothetical protein
MAPAPSALPGDTQLRLNDWEAYAGMTGAKSVTSEKQC